MLRKRQTANVTKAIFLWSLNISCLTYFCKLYLYSRWLFGLTKFVEHLVELRLPALSDVTYTILYKCYVLLSGCNNSQKKCR